MPKVCIAKYYEFNIAILKMFLPNICHKLDKHLPYILSSILQLWSPVKNFVSCFVQHGTFHFIAKY